MKRIVILVPLLMTQLAFAQQGPNGGPPMQGGQMQGQMREHMGPPQEAFDACKGKKDGDKVSTKTPRGEMSGTCRMVMIPEHPQGQQPRR